MGNLTNKVKETDSHESAGEYVVYDCGNKEAARDVSLREAVRKAGDVKNIGIAYVPKGVLIMYYACQSAA